MAPTCNQQMNFTTVCIDMQLKLYWAIASCSTRSSKGLLECKLQHWNL